MYVQTFSVSVSQVKTDPWAPQNVLQFFLEVPKRVSRRYQLVVSLCDNFSVPLLQCFFCIHCSQKLEEFHRSQTPQSVSWVLSPKFPILGWQSWDIEFQAELGKGTSAHHVPNILCQQGPHDCSALILRLKTCLLNRSISVCC